MTRADEHLYAAKQSGRNRIAWIVKAGEPPDSGVKPSEVPSTQVPMRTPTKSAAHKSTPALELEFVDQDSPIIVDAELNLDDQRLVRLLDWWKGKRLNQDLPMWREEYFAQIEFVQDCAHLHVLEPGTDEIRVQFVGASLIRALGVDPTGFRYTATYSPVTNLLSTASRVFELAKLTCYMKEPLRAFSKDVRHLQSGNFTSEVLFLPFAGESMEVAMLLGATIYVPVAQPADGVAA
ncbi:MAG: hypothetical protein ABL973_17210 [Micropepsaceae bacterium]